MNPDVKRYDRLKEERTVFRTLYYFAKYRSDKDYYREEMEHWGEELDRVRAEIEALGVEPKDAYDWPQNK